MSDVVHDPAIDHLCAAVARLSAGDLDAGRDRLGAIDQLDLTRLRAEARREVAEAVRASGWKSPAGHPRGPTAGVRRRYTIYNSDGWTCRWEHCRRRTASCQVMQLVSLFAPDVFRYHDRWKTGRCHEMHRTHTAQYEHKVPASTGAADVDGDANVCTACSICQYAKRQVPMEVLGWRPSETVTDGTWDGLTRSLPGLISSLQRVRPEVPIPASIHQAVRVQRALGVLD